MKNPIRKAIAAGMVVLGAVGLSGCGMTVSDADRASENLSTAADQFEINRRIVFYNGITEQYILQIEGRCSILDQGNQLEVTCKIADNEYKKHFLGLSDNVTYLAEQLDTADVSVYHHRVILKPQNIIPQIDVQMGDE